MTTPASYQAGNNRLSHTVIGRSNGLAKGTHVGMIAFLAAMVSLLWLVGFASSAPTHTSQKGCDAAATKVREDPGINTPTSPVLKPLAESCTVSQIYKYALGFNHGHLSQRSKIRLAMVGYSLANQWPGSPLAVSYKAADGKLAGPSKLSKPQSS